MRCAPRWGRAAWRCATWSPSGARGTASPRRSTPRTSPRSRASGCARSRCGGSTPRRASRGRGRGRRPPPAGGGGRGGRAAPPPRGRGGARAPPPGPARRPGGAEGSGGAPRPGAEAIAILDTGADVAPGGGVGGYDALDRDADPAPGTDPRAPRRREATGTALAGIVAGAGERVIPIRVAGFGPASPEGYATSDSLLPGLGRAVDPAGDGATGAPARAAPRGGNAPHPGLGGTPRAQAPPGRA